MDGWVRLVRRMNSPTRRGPERVEHLTLISNGGILCFPFFHWHELFLETIFSLGVFAAFGCACCCIHILISFRGYHKSTSLGEHSYDDVRKDIRGSLQQKAREPSAASSGASAFNCLHVLELLH